MATNHENINKEIKRDAKTGRISPTTSLDKPKTQEHLEDVQNEVQELLPLSPELEQLLEDSWEDNEELYWALKK